MTLWCFLSWDSTGVLLELDEGSYRLLLLGLYAVHGLDLLWSLEWAGGTSTWGWSSMWCVAGQKLWVLWKWHRSASMVASAISMMWPLTASVGVVMTMTPISTWLGLWPWSAVPIFVPVMVSRSWSGAMPGVGILSMMMCRCSWWWYPIWTVCYYITILHHIQSNIHLGNDVWCDLTLDIGSIGLPCWTLH